MRWLLIWLLKTGMTSAFRRWSIDDFFAELPIRSLGNHEKLQSHHFTSYENGNENPIESIAIVPQVHQVHLDPMIKKNSSCVSFFPGNLTMAFWGFNPLFWAHEGWFFAVQFKAFAANKIHQSAVRAVDPV